MVAATKTKTIEDMAAATLKRLETKDPGLKALLKKAYAYAVFPSVGKASLVIGGAYGKGAVFERGKFVGYATIGQTTIGVQIGGDTFAEIIVFENKEAFERLKKGKMAFAADASAVLVKAGAAAGKGFGDGTSAFVYGTGGMLLEAAIGGQKFKFKAADEGEDEDEQEDQGARGQARGGSGRSAGKKSSASNGAARKQNKRVPAEEAQAEDQGENETAEEPGLMSRATEGIRSASTRVTDFVKEHPVAATAVAVGAAGAIALLVWRPWESIGSDGAYDQADDSGDEAAEDEGDEQATAEDQYDDEGETADQAEDQYQDEGDEEPQEEEADDTRYATRGGRGRR